jgi:hypothetical protein
MPTKTVKIFKNRHANLDSLPLRYGFNFPETTSLTLNFDSKTLEEGKKPGSYSIFAEFTNPETKKTEKGFFYLINNFKKNLLDEVMTVIAERTITEHHLSAVMKSLRESGKITVTELIQMHPIYISGKIKKHADLVDYLADKKSKIELEKIKKTYDEKFKKISNESLQIDDLEELLDQKTIDSENQNERIINLEQKINELNQISENVNKERESLDPVQKGRDYPGVDWHASTLTTAIFDYWSEQGDFLHVYLIGRNKPIRLKNTFKYDYPIALDAVKKLSKGERFDYVTKGSGTFDTDQWFSKIINTQGFSPLENLRLSKKSFNEEEMLEKYGEPPQWVKDSHKYPTPPPTEEEILRDKNTNWDRVEKFCFTDEVMNNLNQQQYVAETTFKVIYAERYPGSWFMQNWKRDMVVLYTDQGWFIDTTVREHGGTEWIEDDTYHNCRVTMTKGNKTPYWLQK